jgi:hypothetical protein
MLDGYNEVMKSFLLKYHVFYAQIAIHVLEKLPTKLRHTCHKNFIPYQEVFSNLALQLNAQ